MPIQEGTTAAYPQAERLELREELHGREVADPYRWLEDTGDPRTREWSAGQDELFAACQARWLSGAAAAGLERRLAELAGAGTVTVGGVARRAAVPHPAPARPGARGAAGRGPGRGGAGPGAAGARSTCTGSAPTPAPMTWCSATTRPRAATRSPWCHATAGGCGSRWTGARCASTGTWPTCTVTSPGRRGSPRCSVTWTRRPSPRSARTGASTCSPTATRRTAGSARSTRSVPATSTGAPRCPRTRGGAHRLRRP